MNYVIVRSENETDIITVIGNRNGEPFSTVVNAQRSLTRRRKRRGMGKKFVWEIKRITS